jgi:eukaryotic-like serine/threonine-protein kinase
MIYHNGSFSSGTEAVAYCAAHGRTTTNQCVGRFLSDNPADISYTCRPPGGPRETSCFRP